MNAAIITIGEEILIGQVVDTNSAWIANELNIVGVSVREIVSISDSGKQIKDTINHLLKKYDIVISTGGLGPTSDDITKQTLCEYFGTKLILHQETLNNIKSIFISRGLPLTELNERQAEVPQNCEVLINPTGTAPGMWFNINDKVLVSIPGVPFEMQAIMELHVIPRLKTANPNKQIVHRVVQTFGLPESFLAEILTEWEQNLSKNISVAYLPNPMSIRIRLTSLGDNTRLIESEIQKLHQIIPEIIFGYDDDTMASVVGKLLIASNSNLSIAESCTGGSISHFLTLTPGSSRYFLGGVIAYSNRLKIKELGVDKNLIKNYGAVSQPVVEAMAIGVKKKFNSDYSISTSGIAGPTGATKGKPVGTVWVAVASSKSIISKQFKFGNNRERNILRSSVAALNMLRLLIQNEKNG